MNIENVRAEIENILSQHAHRQTGAGDFTQIVTQLMASKPSINLNSNNSNQSSAIFGAASDIASLHLQHSLDAINSNSTPRPRYDLQLIKSPVQTIDNELKIVDSSGSILESSSPDDQARTAVDPIVIELRIVLSRDAETNCLCNC